jgi:hypothetical protein
MEEEIEEEKKKKKYRFTSPESFLIKNAIPQLYQARLARVIERRATPTVKFISRVG